MTNYIVINGKKTELTEEQLKQLGIECKRKNPFDRVALNENYYAFKTDIVPLKECNDITDKVLYDNAYYFNDKDFAIQVAFHELLNRKLLKYAYDNEAEDCVWNNVKSHYRIVKNSNNDFVVLKDIMYKTLWAVYFSTEEVATQAIKDVVEPFMEEHPEFVW